MSLAIISEVRRKYPSPLGPKHAEFLLDAARTLGGGLLKLSGAGSVALPDGTTVKQDIIVLNGTQAWDVLSDAANWAFPAWTEAGTVDRSRVYAVSPVEAPSVPQNPIPPPPPSQGPAPIEDQILGVVEPLLEPIRASQAETLEVLANIVTRIAALEARPVGGVAPGTSVIVRLTGTVEAD